MSRTESPDDLYFKALELQKHGDFIGAFDLFMQGHSLGDDGAQHAIGIAYDAGLGVERDKEKAISWFKKAWKTGKQTGYCMSIALTCLEMGQNRRAMYWWQKAILLGDGSAALALAKFLLQMNKPQLSNRVIDLLKRAVNSPEAWQISLNEREEAQELLGTLGASPQMVSELLLPAT